MSDSPRIAEIQAMAYVNGWQLDEIYEVNLDDPEMSMLIQHNLIRIVDDEIRASIPTQPMVRHTGGCSSCGGKR